MGGRAPRELVTEAADLPPGDDERFAGYGVMSLPFSSGHFLALRVFLASSVGPGYRAVWHRDPAGRWTIYATEAPERSCARYFGAALSATVRTPIDVAWTSGDALSVTVPGVLDWNIQLGRTGTTRLLSRMGVLLPGRAWRSNAVLTAMGPMAGALLGAGRVGLRGTVPNGQRFQAAPRRLWAVTRSTARLHGSDLGPLGPLDEQDRLGDFWLPQRGLFAVGQSIFEPYDPGRHRPASAGREVPHRGAVR
jgi:hypothetical protein